jgi:hypothetical protein
VGGRLGGSLVIAPVYHACLCIMHACVSCMTAVCSFGVDVYPSNSSATSTDQVKTELVTHACEALPNSCLHACLMCWEPARGSVCTQSWQCMSFTCTSDTGCGCERHSPVNEVPGLPRAPPAAVPRCCFHMPTFTSHSPRIRIDHAREQRGSPLACNAVVPLP